MIHNTIFNKLVKIGIINKEGKRNFSDYLKLKSSGYMDLNIDFLYDEDNGSYVIAIAHNYIQNGDVMADPDMEISIIPEMKMAEALSYRLDGIGINQHVYQYDENGNKLVSKRLKGELNRFLNSWLGNIKKQGFKNSV